MSDTPQWVNKYGADDEECWELPGVIEPIAKSSSGCGNCYPVLEVSEEHRAIIAAAIAEAKESTQ